MCHEEASFKMYNHGFSFGAKIKIKTKIKIKDTILAKMSLLVVKDSNEGMPLCHAV